MARELTELAPYTAYAKVVEEDGSGQRVKKGKIKTSELPRALCGEEIRKILDVIEKNSLTHCVSREQIDADILSRQNSWRGSTARETYIEDAVGEKQDRSLDTSRDADEPPPRISLQKPKKQD